MILIFKILLLAAVLCVGARLMVQYPRLIGIFLLIVSVKIIVEVFRGELVVDFLFNKLLLMSLSSLCLLFFYKTDIYSNRSFLSLAYYLLAINILIVIVYDLLHNNQVNALSGCLVLGLLFFTPLVEVCNIGKERNFCWDLGKWWIFLYTFWVLVFCFIDSPEVTGVNLAILIAPILLSIKNFALWMQYRILTLWIAMIILYFNFPLFKYINTNNWGNDVVIVKMEMIMFLVLVIYCICFGFRGYYLKKVRYN